MKTKALTASLTGVSAQIKQGAFIGLFGFFCGFGQLWGSMMPFGMACVAAVPKEHLPTAIIGVLVGTLLSAGTGGGRYPTAFFLILLLRLLLGRTIRQGRMKPVLLSLLCMGGGALSIFFVSLLFPPSPVYLFLQTAELILSGTLAYFFALAGSVLLRSHPPVLLTFAQQTALGILLLSIITILTGVPVSVCNPGLIAGGLAVLYAGRRWGLSGASIAGILISMGLCLGNFRLLSLCGVLIPACFLSGVFSPLGKGGQTVSLLLISAFGFLLLGMPVFLLYRLADLLLACLLYLLLPVSRIGTVHSGEVFSDGTVPLRLMQEGVSSRLQFAADALTDLREHLQTVSRSFAGLTVTDSQAGCDQVADRVCRDCVRSSLCWNRWYDKTAEQFTATLAKAQEKGYCSVDLLPGPLQESCCRPTTLADAFHQVSSALTARETDRIQLDFSRTMMLEQFLSLSGMLRETGSTLGHIGRFDASLTRQCLTAFTKLEGNPDRLFCTVDRLGRAHLEIFTSQPCTHSPTELCEALSEATGVMFASPTVTAAGQKTKLSFYEIPDYRVDFSVQQSCFTGNEICGDNATCFTDAQGYTYLLISDGMGNGGRAAIDSAMTCSLMEKLLLAGFGTEASLKLLNASLLTKSTDESLSTVDLARIDCYTGTVTCYKAGAAVSYLCNGNEVQEITASSLPVGIMPAAEYEKTVARLRPEHFLVMVSDGVTNEDGWLTDAILKNAHRPARQISANLIYEAKQHTADHPDDMTVLVAKLQKNQ